MDPIMVAILVALTFLVCMLVRLIILWVAAKATAADIRRRIDDINTDISENKDPMVTDDGVFRYWELPDRAGSADSDWLFENEPGEGRQ